MSYYRIVVTCGVSAFGGVNALRKWAEDANLLKFPTSSPNPEPPDGQNEQQALEEIQRKLASPDVLDGITEDPKRISAEYSALQALKNERRISDNPQVVLIHTDTLGGKAAALLISKLLTRDFNAQVECIECSVNVDDRKQLRHNLGDFMQKVATALRDHDKHTTCFAPLGGYKVMTSLGYLAGAYFGFPTLYAHEDKQLAHEIPPIPVRVPPDQLQQIAPLLKKVGDGYERNTLTTDEQRLLDDNAWLFEHADGFVCVNAFGLFLMQENPELFGVKLLVSNEVHRTYGNDGRKAFIVQQLGVLAAKLTAGSTEADLVHERDWDVEPYDDWHLYKGASNGQLVMRAVYKYDREENTLTVKNVWTSHDYVEDFKAKWTEPLGDTIEWKQS